MKQYIMLLLSMYGSLLMASDDLIRQQYEATVNYGKDYANHSGQLLNTLDGGDGDSFYRCRNYIFQAMKIVQEYQARRSQLIDDVFRIGKKSNIFVDVDDVQKCKKDSAVCLHIGKSVVKDQQKKLAYCDECTVRVFADYNRSDELVSGYDNLESIPQVGLFIKDKNPKELRGQLNDMQRQYVNMVHGKHHELENDGTYAYARDLKPVSLVYKGQTVRVKSWDLLHSYVGDLKRGFFTGVHIQDSDLFTHFYDRDKNTITIRKDPKYHKESTFFPQSWDLKTCLKKAHEALQNPIDIQPGDVKYGAHNLVVRGAMQPGQDMILVVDPTQERVVSFYLDI